MRESRGATEGSTENEYRDRNWAVKVEWVEGTRGGEMHAGWVSHEYLQPEGLLHVDHGPYLHLGLGLLYQADHRP